MKCLPLLLVLLVPLTAQGDNQKNTDYWSTAPQQMNPEGWNESSPSINVKAETLPVGAKTTSTVRTTAPQADSVNQSTKPNMTKNLNAHYQQLEIVSPKPNAVISTQDNQLNVKILLTPALKQGNIILVTLDDFPVAMVDTNTTSFNIKLVTPGKHTLRIHVANANQKSLISSAPVTLFMKNNVSGPVTIISPPAHKGTATE